MSLHNEINFEAEICQHLGASGWLYADGDATGYDRGRALFPADVLAWVQATQPKAWETLAKNHGANAGETLLARLRDQLDQRGTLAVLRQGIELLGLKQPLKLAEFKPALAINTEILARYAANRLTAKAVRELLSEYSRRVKCANTWQVFASGNWLNVTEDLARRSLVIFLFDPDKAGARVTPNPHTNEWIFSSDYRAKACAALWPLLRNWCDAGMGVRVRELEKVDDTFT